MNTNFNQINPAKIVQDLLDDPNTKLSVWEKIAALAECVERGRVVASKPMQATPIVLLGNTGSGKSTIINYLAGCQLGTTRLPNGVGKVVYVKPESTPPELASIGHKMISQTFIPELIEYENKGFIDCPGFQDSRGFVIDVANIINTVNVLNIQNHLKFIFLCSYESLRSDKASGLMCLVRTVKALFSTAEDFKAIKGSILFGITKIPTDDPLGEDIQELTSWLLKENRADPESYEILKTLTKNLFIFDPLNQPNKLNYTGGLNRSDLLERIENLTPAQDHQLEVHLNADSREGLREMCESVKASIKSSLINQDYDGASSLLELLDKLDMIKHKYVKDLTIASFDTVVTHFEAEVTKLLKLIADGNPWSPSMSAILEGISFGISAFGLAKAEQIKNKIEFSRLLDIAGQHRSKMSFLSEFSDIQALANDFTNFLLLNDIDSAENILRDLNNRWKILIKKPEFSGIDIDSQGFDIGRLKEQLVKAKDTKAEMEKKMSELRQRRGEYNQQLQNISTAQGEERREIAKQLDLTKQLIDGLSKEAKEIDLNHQDGFKGILGQVVRSVCKVAFTVALGQLGGMAV